MNDLRQKIEATNKQIEKLKAKKKALQAKERNAKRTQKRKDDTRKKILAGAALENYFKRKGKIILDAREERDQSNKHYSHECYRMYVMTDEGGKCG